MKAFQIGRTNVVGPWPNMTPPIRGGPLDEQDILTSCDAELPAAAFAASRGRSTGFLDIETETDTESESVVSSILRTRTRSSSPPPSSTTSVSDLSDSLPPKCPVNIIDWAIEQDLDKCLRDYPSVDPQVQQSIVRRYRQLHQTIIDEGLYECRYTEYMKEIARYTTLFALFLGLLRNGWYLTSAVFLGLFWVCLSSHQFQHA